MEVRVDKNTENVHPNLILLSAHIEVQCGNVLLTLDSKKFGTSL